MHFLVCRTSPATQTWSRIWIHCWSRRSGTPTHFFGDNRDERRTLEHWSAFAQIVGNAAVIVTLAILAVQIRGNTKAVRYQINLERYRTIIEPGPSEVAIAIQSKVAQIDGMPLTAATLKERYQLTDEQAVLWVRKHAYMFRMLESEFESFGPGAELSRAIRILMISPDVRISWEKSGVSRSPSFKNFVETARSSSDRT